MPHGRVPIANGVIEKADILAAVKSNNVHISKIAHGSLVEENEQLKETNEQLRQTNVLLMEENSVNRELILRFYADFEKEPPADLLNRLANIDPRHHQGTGSSHAATDPDDMRSNGNDLDDYGDDEGSDDVYGDEGYDGMYGRDEMDGGYNSDDYGYNGW
ncbi:uncharacterized protein LOC133896234 isoform X1 [Phragmites australis]|uniref:uncharacterized protein LOC133896234 isoform X1 n=1 Tax=Phragmites australis TaxID=29695 RepID=UPI002D767881|nr:uncharacterized protein LOC133896234 isoform X1 [Phragmites australis]